MRIKIFKRLMVLIAAVSLIGVAGYFIWSIQVDKMARSVVARAERAEEKKNYGEAVDLYQQHLMVVPDDVDVQIKYADALIKWEKTQKHQEDAMAIYNGILKQQLGRDDVRRRAAELAVDMGGPQFEVARRHLSILLGHVTGDGHLEFLMGRCWEQDQDAAQAAEKYRSAIEHGAPERLEAAQRLAALLRKPLGQLKEADGVIEAMVQADPNNDRVYLERGRYRRRFDLPGAADDFQKALDLAPDQPEAYLEAAQLAEQKSGLDAARPILDKGLDKAPKSPRLYLALAELERRAGRMDESIKVMEDAIEKMPGQVQIRFPLAMILAARGDTSKLYLQIQEMKNSGVNPIVIDYLTAYYHVNKNEFSRARQILASLQPMVGHHGEFKARVNVLLARCYSQLGEPELQWDASKRAVDANPEDLQAKLDYIQGMANRGDLNGAIEQYRRIVAQVPQIRIYLVRLLIARNQQRPKDQREWGEIERLLGEAAKAAPESAEPVVLQAVLFAEQDQIDKARDLLATARSQFPKAVEPWIAEAQLLGREKKFDEALSVLDRAQKMLGDHVEFRLARARLWVYKGGPQAPAALNGLADQIETFSKESRRALLATLATELGRHQDIPGAVRMWSRLAELDPEVLDPHLRLFDLALQAADTARITQQIEAIEKIDPLHGLYCQADYLIWQAARAEDKAVKERLRTDARALLTELKTRRPDWAPLPLAAAKIEEQELVQGGLDEDRKREKQESLITSYLRAIDLGARDSAVLRRTVYLLFATGQGSEALQLMNRIPSVAQFIDLGRLASRYAVENRDFRQAEEIARNAAKARPNDFQERIWLVKVLMDSGNLLEAESELHKAIDEAKTDPDRRITLVQFLVLTSQLPKAEEAVREAEKSLLQSPLALAQCCETMGRSYQGSNMTDQAKKWYDEARKWFVKAQADRKDPNDQTIDRQLAAFLLRTNQIAEAQKQLQEIQNRKGGAQGKATTAWAKRSLALTYIAGNPREPAKALAILEAGGRQDGVDDPEDQRVLARVLEAQGTPEHRKRAIETLNTLVNKTLANSEDRFLLAQLEEADGQWIKARDQYRELILRTDNPRDMETIRRRPDYLARFAESLLNHHQPGEEADLTEVQELIEKLRQVQPDLLAVLVLDVRLSKARNRVEEAADRIRTTMERPKLSLEVRLHLAALAEQIDQFKLAEQIYRKIAAESAILPNQARLIQFLMRHNQLDDALDFCDSLWKEGRDREAVARLALTVLADSNIPATPARINRVVAWLEQGVRENSQSTLYRLCLGNLYELLGQDQKAKDQYRAVINIGDREGTASNNLAWLMALKGDSSERSDALVLINKAIQIQRAQPAPLSRLPDFLDTRGVVYLSIGQGQNAVEDLEAAVAAQPTDSKLFHLAQAYLEVKDKEKAKKNLEAALTKGLPKGLHHLEMAAYQKVRNELGMP
jgi:tetratricopeptide (TPR) repeat protein/Flp pilus assembly protein TadD